MRENNFQPVFMRKLRATFPGCLILKNDSSYIQGIPDLLLLYGDRWAAFEVKASEREPYQANQEYYIDMLDDMSFAARVSPENMAKVLDAVQRAFSTYRPARVLKR